jgi:hypothetical protein
MKSFEDLFRSGDAHQDAFRARLFGLFSEEVVRTWAGDARAEHGDLGRPTLIAAGEARGTTLDFTLRRRSDDARFVAELKAELAFEGHRYLRLTTPRQLDHHAGGEAFRRFLSVTKKPTAYAVRVGGKSMDVAGGILVWGAISPGGRRAVIEEFGFADVLSPEDMLSDRHDWGSAAWRQRISTYRRWAAGLLDAL